MASAALRTDNRARDESRDALPPLPPANERGNYPALETARTILARNIIQDRRKAGLSRAELAKRARIREATLAKVESGQYSVSVATIDRIDRALKKALARKPGKDSRRGKNGR
jgi:ribosome-binding protein aMBF1 (putative translation factor)